VSDSRSYDVAVERLIPAPVDAVYRTWTAPETLPRWFGPPGHTVTTATFDLTVGGTYSITMRSPENRLYTLQGSFLQVEPEALLTYTWRWDRPELGDYETRVSVTFRKEGEQTRIAIHHSRFHTEEHAKGHHVGWEGSLNRIIVYMQRLRHPPHD